MATKNKFSRQGMLIILDMIICLICPLSLGIFSLEIGFITSMKIEIIVVSVILLPLTMVASMIFCKGYPKEHNISEKQFNRSTVAVFLGVFIYVIYDILFMYYDIIAFKIISALVAGSCIIQLRVIDMRIVSKKHLDLNKKLKTKKNTNLYDVNNDNIEVYEFNKKLRIVKK